MKYHHQILVKLLLENSVFLNSIIKNKNMYIVGPPMIIQWNPGGRCPLVMLFPGYDVKHYVLLPYDINNNFSSAWNHSPLLEKK